MPPMPPQRTTVAQRQARSAWRLLYADAGRALALAEQAQAGASARGDASGEAWAALVCAFHQLYFGLPADAAQALQALEARFDGLGDRRGWLLSRIGGARAQWRQGQAQAALALLLPLRDEGLRLLQHDQRAVLLNAIAGCYSAQGRSEEAFAYMFQALREAGPRRGHGYDVVLHCNISHELLELGDHDEALAQTELGLARCRELADGRLKGVLLVNRIIALTELGRAAEALDDVRQVANAPRGSQGRGMVALHFESLAVAAVQAGELALARQLTGWAHEEVAADHPAARVECAIALARLALAEGAPDAALAALGGVQRLLTAQGDDAPGLRLQCAHAQALADVHEARGQPQAALQALRHWQGLHAERTRRASAARYQAAALQTELDHLAQQLVANEERPRAAERARAELAQTNEALQRTISEVQALQTQLQQQVRQDALTGLANRRHLNDSLPGVVALALREVVPLAVVVIDLDRFKLVNDTHGHPAGDQLLAASGRLLRQHLRCSDQAFRYGGEEFCLLMPHTRAPDAQRTCLALLQAWRAQAFTLDCGAHLSDQTFSAGVADTQSAPPTPTALLRAADQLLLLAKRAGRAQVLAAGSAGPGA